MHKQQLHKETIPVYHRAKIVKYYYEEWKPLRPIIFALHANETTGIPGGLNFIQKNGGELFEMFNRGFRYIKLEKIEIDPNRIFTPNGIESSLYLNRNKKNIKTLYEMKNTILSLFDPELTPLIISLHNNSGEFNIAAYKSDPKLQQHAEKIEIQNNNHRNFYLVTESSHFEFLKKRGWNVVLQSKNPIPDDGSFSIYCGKKKIPYINIETEFEQFELQRKMIFECESLFLEEQNKKIEEQLADRESAIHLLHLLVTTDDHLLISKYSKFKEIINVSDATGNTPLIIATKYENAETIATLIKMGAILNITNSEGKAAIDYAKESKNYKILKNFDRNQIK